MPPHQRYLLHQASGLIRVTSLPRSAFSTEPSQLARHCLGGLARLAEELLLGVADQSVEALPRDLLDEPSGSFLVGGSEAA